MAYMAQEYIFITSGFGIVSVLILLLFLRLSKVLNETKKVNNMLSVIMQVEDKNASKIMNTVKQVVANSIDDLRKDNNIIEKNDDKELYEKIKELFEDEEGFYTISQLQRIVHVGYAKVARVLDELSDNQVIVQVENNCINTTVWQSTESHELINENDEDEDEDDVEIDDDTKEKFKKALEDPLYKKVRKWALSTNDKITPDDLQRTFSIGYTQTSYLYDFLVLDGKVQKNEKYTL